MNRSKTLGICIPTYRRPELLERCVRSAIESADGCPIEICIADDSVSNINDSVLQGLLDLHSFVVMKRNEVNLGIDDNIQNVVDMSRSDFVWLIGEDDIFVAGAVANMYVLIQALDAPFIFSNYKFVTENLDTNLGEAIAGSTSRLIDAGKFIATDLWAIGFIGACVVRRLDWVATDPADYKGTYFTHVGRIISMLAAKPQLYFSSFVAIANRAQGEDTFTWKKDSFGVFLGFERMCATAARHHPSLRAPLNTAIVTYRQRFAYFSFKTALRLRAETAFDLRQYRAYVHRSNLPWIKKSWFLLLALIPVYALKPVTVFYEFWRTSRSAHRARP